SLTKYSAHNSWTNHRIAYSRCGSRREQLKGSKSHLLFPPKQADASAFRLRGRVEMWRGGGRWNISVAASFVRRCLTGSTVAPFPHPAHRTGQADLPHPALGQDLTPSPTARRVQARSGVRARNARKGAGVVSPALASSDLVLDAQPPAQPHSGVVVDRPVRFGDGAYIEVVRPSAQRAVQLAHQLCGLLPCPGSDCQRVNVFHHALDALLRWPARLAGSR